jgi:rubrerythrin
MADEVTEGGEPVCWLDRVCPDCGLLVEDAVRPPHCPRCGADMPADAEAS